MVVVSDYNTLTAWVIKNAEYDDGTVIHNEIKLEIGL